MDFNDLRMSSHCTIKLGFDGGSATFGSAESALQAFKNPSNFYDFAKMSADEAKKMGRVVTLRPDWDSIKAEICKRVLLIKFEDKNTREALLASDDSKIRDNWVGTVLKEVKKIYTDNPNFAPDHNVNEFFTDYLKELEEKRKAELEAEEKSLNIGAKKQAHCFAVAEVMKSNAEFYDLNPEESYIIGLLHDIGYIRGRKDHEKSGYELLTSVGLKNEKALNAVKYHGCNPKDVPEDIRKDNLYISLIDADMTVDARGQKIGYDGRLKDIELRYGKDHIAYETAKATIDYVKESRARILAEKTTELEFDDSGLLFDFIDTDKIPESRKDTFVADYKRYLTDTMMEILREDIIDCPSETLDIPKGMTEDMVKKYFTDNFDTKNITYELSLTDTDKPLKEMGLVFKGKITIDRQKMFGKEEEKPKKRRGRPKKQQPVKE